MSISSRNLGGGHILCVADTFDDILRQLSTEYFASVYCSVTSVLDELNIAPKLEIGWMHPGYACTAEDSDIPSLSEPAGLFGWVSQSTNLNVSGARRSTIATLCRKQQPKIQWATCSGRLFRFNKTSASNWDQIHDRFVDYAVFEPSDWCGPICIPDRKPPSEVWRQLVFAAAIDDSKLEQAAWTAAREIYTPTALRLLARGVENTRQCINW